MHLSNQQAREMLACIPEIRRRRTRVEIRQNDAETVARLRSLNGETIAFPVESINEFWQAKNALYGFAARTGTGVSIAFDAATNTVTVHSRVASAKENRPERAKRQTHRQLDTDDWIAGRDALIAAMFHMREAAKAFDSLPRAVAMSLDDANIAGDAADLDEMVGMTERRLTRLLAMDRD